MPFQPASDRRFGGDLGERTRRIVAVGADRAHRERRFEGLELRRARFDLLEEDAQLGTCQCLKSPNDRR